jgi:hypothetical protein
MLSSRVAIPNSTDFMPRRLVFGDVSENTRKQNAKLVKPHQ